MIICFFWQIEVGCRSRNQIIRMFSPSKQQPTFPFSFFSCIFSVKKRWVSKILLCPESLCINWDGNMLAVEIVSCVCSESRCPFPTFLWFQMGFVFTFFSKSHLTIRANISRLLLSSSLPCNLAGTNLHFPSLQSKLYLVSKNKDFIKLFSETLRSFYMLGKGGNKPELKYLDRRYLKKKWSSGIWIMTLLWTTFFFIK